MATDSARTRIRPRTYQIWQIPTFLLGLASLTCVWFIRPHWQPTAAERLGRDTAALKSALDSQVTPADQLEKILTRIDAVPPVNWTTPLRMLAGNGYLRLAESVDRSDEASGYFQKAHEKLDVIPIADLSVEEAKLWNYRVARLAAHDPKSDATAILTRLAATLPIDDERAEGHRLIGEWYLRIDPPVEAKARAAFKEFLQAAPPRTRPALLAKSRLEIGKICLHLNELDEARKALERIGPDAPADIYAAARTSLARAALNEGDWPQALRILEQARETKGMPPAAQELMRYELANVYLRADRREEALEILVSLKNTLGEAGQAAGLKLALLRGIEPANAENLLEELERFVGNQSRFTGNALFTTAEIREIGDTAFTIFIRDRRFPAAERLAKIFANFGELGRDKIMMAEIQRAGAEAAATPEERAEFINKGVEQMAALIATPTANTTLKREWLKKAIEYEAQVNAPKEAIAHFDQLISALGGPAKIDGDLWLKKGQLQTAAGDAAGAVTTFEMGLNRPGNAEIALRTELATAMLAQQRYADAKKQLELNLQNPDLANQPAVREKTLYALGDAHFELREWQTAIERFSEAAGYYTETGPAVSARYKIGRSHWNLAMSEFDTVRDLRKTLTELPELADGQKREMQAKISASYRLSRDHMASARKAYLEVEGKLATSPALDDLKSPIALLWKSAAFSAAEVCLRLDEYEDAQKRYDKLAQRFEGKVEQLAALSGVYESLVAQQKRPQAKLIYTQIRTNYTMLKDDAYDTSAPDRTKKYWAEWLSRIQ